MVLRFLRHLSAWRLLGAALLTPVCATAAGAEEVTVSGLLAYREPYPLPAGAVATVHLLEDGSPVAEATAERRRAPPLPFELTYDEALIAADGGYTLSAEIRLGEQVIFKSAQPQRLSNPETSQKVSLVVGMVRD